jgi:gluconokinase
MTRPVLIICMGVSCCGKTTLARALAERFDLIYLEADDFHSVENKAQMAAGKPLTDEMRAPWIENICESLGRELAAGKSVVLACSALRKSHRQQFRETGFSTHFLFLDGSRELIGQWINSREGHFMSPALLDSQFRTLESPADESDTTRIRLEQGWPAVLEEASRITASLT